MPWPSVRSSPGSSRSRAPIDAVGEQVIDHAPSWLIETGKDLFGTGDKAALRVGIAVILAIVAGLLGVASVRRRWIGVVGFAAFGVVGVLAAAGLPDEPSGAWVAPVLGTVAGIVVLLRLVPHPPGPRRTPGPVAGAARVGPPPVPGHLGCGGRRRGSRRRAPRWRWSGGGSMRSARRSRTRCPRRRASVAVPAGADGLVPGTPFITPNGDFYRIDTALSFPRISLSSWRVDIGGMVGRRRSP